MNSASQARPWTFEIEELPENFVRIRTDRDGFLTMAHPMIQDMLKTLNDQGYQIDKSHRFETGSFYFKVSPPGAPRIFTFKYLQKKQLETYY